MEREFDIVNDETGEIIFETIALDLAVAEISHRGWTTTGVDHHPGWTFIYVNCSH